jgi:tetratricopeptide (TPR) repeat protein
MNLKYRNAIILTLIFVLLAGMTHLVHKKIRGDVKDILPPKEVLYLPKGDYVKVVAMGFDSMWADVLWLRTLQYFGGHFMADKEYPIMDRLLDVITTLEPRFPDAYSFGGMVLQEEMNRRDKAVDFLKEGIKNNPDNWRLAYELGFLWFEAARQAKDTTAKKYDSEQAISAYTIATARPGCPEFVGRIINQMYYEGGEKEVAYQLWTMTKEDAEAKGDKFTAQIAEDKLLLMKFQDAADPVQRAVMKYYEKTKKIVPNLQMLVTEGYIDRIPKDPVTGGPLAYDPRNGRVYSKAKPQFSSLIGQ